MTAYTTKLLDTLIMKKQRLDRYRPFPREVEKNLNEWFLVELTYTSNAIEGNTLTRQETAMVVEKNLTVEGKTVTEHLEATNHAEAFRYVQSLVSFSRQDITANEVLKIHRLILQKINFEQAGRYRSVSVRIAGSTVALPNAMKVPQLMDDYFQWLHGLTALSPITRAADAHYKLVRIHPFVDGNGRTARLLMNLLLMQAGYPPAAIRPEDRSQYIHAIETANKTGSMDAFRVIVYEAINRSLDMYLAILEKDISNETLPVKLLKIGELARSTGEASHTIRFWTKAGLLLVSAETQGRYQLYHPSMIERVKRIRQLQDEKRLTIAEIRVQLQKAA